MKVQTPAPLVLQTKLLIPEIKGKVITRDRLVALLLENMQRKIILLIADAGYGKTTLISQWVKTKKFRYAFYALGEEDCSFELFITHLIAGFQQRNPNWLTRTSELVRQRDETEYNVGMVMGTLINELHETCAEDFYLILDDYHLIANAGLVHDALQYLLDHLPPRIHVVIASRTTPDFMELVKWRSKQFVFELSRQDLSFSHSEMKLLIEKAYGISLSSTELKRIEQHTEGWVTGIQLILQASGIHRSAIKDTLNGYLEANQPMFEYFANEVLAHEPQSIQDFLVKCSVLESLTPLGCNTLLGRKDSQSLLNQIEHRHLFLYKIEDNQFRFHHLFGKFLNQRLILSGKHKQLHRRAARYYRRQRQYDLSIKHNLAAGNYKQAGTTILRSIYEDTAGRISGGIDASILRKYLFALPQSVLNERTQLMVIKGTLQRDAGDHDGAKNLYYEAERLSRASGDMVTRAHSLSELGLLHWLRGEHKQAISVLKHALLVCPRSELKMKLHILNLLGLAWQDLSRLDKAKYYLRKAKQLTQKLCIFYNQIVLESNLATILLQEGDIQHAYSLCKILIQRLGSQYYYKVGVIYANSARAAMDSGDLSWAETCLEQGWSVCRPYEDRVSFAALNHCYGILHMHKQQWTTAQHHLEESQRILHSLRWKRMESSVLRNIGLMRRLQGDAKSSMIALKQAQDLLVSEGTKKSAHSIFIFADQALAEVSLGRYARARKMSAECRRRARKVHWRLGEFYSLLVNALISLARKRQRESTRLINAMIEMTRKNGHHGILALELQHKPDLVNFIRQFTDHGTYLDKHGIYAVAQQPTLSVRFFGGLDIEDSNHNHIELNWPTEKTRSLFAFLVVNRNKNISRSQVLDSLWSGLNKKKAHENLRTTAYRMRQVIGSARIAGISPDLIFTYAHGKYVLLPNITIDTDVDEYYRLMKRADIARSDGEKRDILMRAFTINCNRYLPEIYDSWVDTHRSFFRERRLDTLQKLIHIVSYQEDDLSCIQYCQEYLRIEPLCEEIVCIYMKSLKKLSRLSEMKTVYQTLKQGLRREINRSVSPETQRQFRELLSRAG